MVLISGSDDLFKGCNNDRRRCSKGVLQGRDFHGKSHLEDLSLILPFPRNIDHKQDDTRVTFLYTTGEDSWDVKGRIQTERHHSRRIPGGAQAKVLATLA